MGEVIAILGDILVSLAALALAGFMLWALLNLTKSPLHPVQRLWWVLAIIILPGIGAAIWFWWRFRYYPKRKIEDPNWDPATRTQGRISGGRPRPSRMSPKQ